MHIHSSILCVTYCVPHAWAPEAFLHWSGGKEVWRRSRWLSARFGEACKKNFDLFSAVRKLLDGWNFAGIVSALTAAHSISTNHQQLLL